MLSTKCYPSCLGLKLLSFVFSIYHMIEQLDWKIFFLNLVTHKPLVAPYGIIKHFQHWFSYSPFACSESSHLSPEPMLPYHYKIDKTSLNVWMSMLWSSWWHHYCINSLRPRLNRRPFADDIFKCIFLNENELFSLKISLKLVLEGPINNISALVRIMAWRRPGDKPLSEPMMVSLLSHICVTRPQWVKDTLWGETTGNQWIPLTKGQYQ